MHEPADRERIAWAAGFFEGEGSITLNGDTLALRLNNTDEAIVQRFSDIVDVGRVYGPYSRERERDGYKRKPFWVWVAQSYCALDALQLLGPWLSERRLSRAYELTGIRFHVLSAPENNSRS